VGSPPLVATRNQTSGAHVRWRVGLGGPEARVSRCPTLYLSARLPASSLLFLLGEKSVDCGVRSTRFIPQKAESSNEWAKGHPGPQLQAQHQVEFCQSPEPNPEVLHRIALLSFSTIGLTNSTNI
jgi:hypothetical protein